MTTPFRSCRLGKGVKLFDMPEMALRLLLDPEPHAALQGAMSGLERTRGQIAPLLEGQH